MPFPYIFVKIQCYNKTNNEKLVNIVKLKKLMKDKGEIAFYDRAVIKEFEDILSGNKIKFSMGTWKSHDSLTYARLILRYILEEKLDLNVDDLKSINVDSLKTKWHINGLLKYNFSDSFQEAVLDIYGEFINPWEFDRSVNYLNVGERKNNWLSDFGEKYLKFNSKKEASLFFQADNLTKNHSKIFSYFKGSPYKIYQYFHEKGYIKQTLHPYDFQKGHQNIWENEENVKSFFAKLLKDKKIKNKNDFIEYINSSAFKKELKGLSVQFRSSTWEIYKYLKENNLTEYELKVFELGKIPTGFYRDDENKVKALCWLIFEKLGVKTREDYLKVFCHSVVKNNIRGIYSFFNNFEEIKDFVAEKGIAPWNPKPWEFKHRPRSLWYDEETRIDAIVWFFETYLNLSGADVSADVFFVKDIWDARLKEMYQPYFSQIYENPKEKWVETYKNTLSPNLTK